MALLLHSPAGNNLWIKSLRFKLVLSSLALCLMFIWGEFFYAGIFQSRKQQAFVLHQQQTVAKLLAAQIGYKINEKLSIINEVAGHLDVTRLGDGGYVQAFLAQQSPLLQIFTGDITVCGRDAAVLAVLPVARGRRGADHADRESVQKVVSTGRAVVSEPVFSSFLNYPIIAICAPVTGPGNQVEGKGQAGWASTGLGLPFCKLAVEAHQGTLGVESAPGEGSCFLVRLPIGN